MTEYFWDGEWIDDEALEYTLCRLQDYELAEMSCENISYTLQMLSLCLSLAEKAQILYIEMRAK